jgi:two-component system sensor histidine kinase/response regulator
MAETRFRILVIDDEEIVLDSCAEMLADGPYTVATASDGALGLRRLEEFQPDLVFVDLKMPGLSGVEVIERIHAFDPSVVIVVITGYATLESAVEAMQKGASDYVPKPFTPDEFRLVTRRSLEKRRLLLETAELRREREALRQNFAAIVSHELRSPLAAVQQNLSLLAGELAGSLTEAQQARLERIKTRLAGVLELIQTWLKVFSTDITHLQDTFAPVAVPAVIDRAVEHAEPYAVRKDIEMVVRVPETLSPVLGDEGTLVEALGNITSNAVKYSHPQSSVTVEADEQDGQILISVTDVGIGIPPDELPHIFGDFYRGTASRVEGTGSGLGLAITRRIIEAHHGTITVQSTPGKGSTFVVTLPVLRSPTRADAAPDGHALQRTT